MPKTIPKCPEKPVRSASGSEELSYDIRLHTPMFGGGVEAGKPDPRMPFRATAIRGQLQFWWRATVGAGCTDAAELWSKHERVWGSTAEVSPVRILVEHFNAPEPVPCGKYNEIPPHSGKWRNRWDPVFPENSLPYALFPFAGEKPERGGDLPKKNPAVFTPSGTFTLRVILPERLLNDVRTAILAWVNFGGMGARTRRGCGSIYCKELTPADLAGAAALVKELLPNPPKSERGWPTLGGPLLMGNPVPDATQAWASAVGALQKFRQGEGFARNRGREGRPGRSLWPEAESIRELAGRRSRDHRRMENIPNDAFPRAELGLPINFQFKDEKFGDPGKTVLYPIVNGEACDRKASPLIIKALGLADNTFVPIVLRLLTTQLDRVALKYDNGPQKYGADAIIRGNRLAIYPNSPMAGTPSGSALDAFINFVQDEDVWGVLG